MLAYTELLQEGGDECIIILIGKKCKPLLLWKITSTYVNENLMLLEDEGQEPYEDQFTHKRVMNTEHKEKERYYYRIKKSEK